MTKIIKKYSSIHVTRGAGRGLISDSSQKSCFTVPLSMIDFLDAVELKSENEVFNVFLDEQPEVIRAYLDFLIEKEIVFFCDNLQEAERFPAMDMTWKYPAEIANGVVEVSSVINIETFLRSKAGLHIPYIQYNLTCDVKDISVLAHLVDKVLLDDVKGVQLYFDNKNAISEQELIVLCNEKSRIETIVAFNSHFEKNLSSLSSRIIFVKQPFPDNSQCGLVDQSYFNLQLPHYTESLVHNTCLNRKISIDVDGNIKNCPSMKESFGNIKDTKLEEVINKPGFQKYWNITKDEITKCKDCEFRHVCTDCRAYLQNPDDVYSAPLKCGYDPYNCQWEDWSINPLKQKAIEYYGISEITNKFLK